MFGTVRMLRGTLTPQPPLSRGAVGPHLDGACVGEGEQGDHGAYCGDTRETHTISEGSPGSGFPWRTGTGESDIKAHPPFFYQGFLAGSSQRQPPADKACFQRHDLAAHGNAIRNIDSILARTQLLSARLRAGMIMQPVRQVNILKGILYMLGAAVMFPIMNSLVKLLARDYPMGEIIWVRTAGQLLFIMLIFMPGQGMRLFKTERLGYQLMRSLLLLIATVFFFTSVTLIPLAEAQAISFTAPLLVAALAMPLLRERVGGRRWLMILVGFAGAVIIIRPGAEVANWGALLVVANSVFYAVYEVLTRMVGGHDRPETSAAYSALIGTVIMSLLVPFMWKLPNNWVDGVLLYTLGLWGGLGHYCVARAFQWGPAAVISPFNYSQLIGATLLGYLMFDQIPGAWTWAGSVIIIASGLYVAFSESSGRIRTPPLK